MNTTHASLSSVASPSFLAQLSPVLLALALAACGGGDDSNYGMVTAFDTAPFTNSTAPATPGRQVFTGLEKTLPNFDIHADSFAFDAAAFGLPRHLSFVNATAAGIPAGGANVIVLQDADDDNNPATPFAAGNAATLIASRVTTDGAGFFIYHNSALNVNRLVFSSNLNDPTADLSVLARIAAPTGPAAIDALPKFRSGNFFVK